MPNLSDFPPSLLSRITRLLEFEDLLRLMLLIGDRAFLIRCTTLGGVEELVATTERSMTLVAHHLPRLPTFSHLTHVKIGCDESHAPEPHDNLDWHLTLPQTLRSLEIRRTCLAPGLLLRPLQDNDDAFTVNHCYQDGFTTESMKDRFPNLHTLIIPQPCHHPLSMQERFINDLPDTITCLDLGDAKSLVGPPLIFALYSYDSQDSLATALAHFTQCRITEDNVSSFMKDATPEALSDLVSPLMHLTSLSLPRIEEHSSNDLIQYLTNLQELSFGYLDGEIEDAAKVMPLPPSLTKLSCHLIAYEQFMQLLEYIPRLPNLTYLEVRQQYEDGDYDAVAELPELPTKLRTLIVEWPFGLRVNAAHPFPTSLTHLDLQIPPFELSSKLLDLTNLRTLVLQIDQIPPECLPPSLTKLDCFCSYELSSFAHLPASIRELSGLSLELTREAYQELTASTPLRGWSQAAFSELLRLRFPHLKNMPDVALSPSKDCMMWIGANISEKAPLWTEFHLQETTWSLPEPVPPSGKFVIPSSVTRIQRQFGTTKVLPRGLLHLKEEVNHKGDSVPLGIATPHLQTLEATVVAIPPSDWSSTLPQSLTSLKISGYPVSHREIDVSSLTSLKRLSIQCCVLDFGNLKPILPNLETLAACIIIRPGIWIVEGLQAALKNETTCDDRQWYQCCLSLLPPRLRPSSNSNNTVCFLLDWQPSVAALVPLHIRSFAFPLQFSPGSYPATVGLLDEPKTWTRMATSALSSCLPGWFPPPRFSDHLPKAGLTRLTLHKRPLSAQDYAALPHSLLHLSLSWNSVMKFYPPSKALHGPGLDEARIRSLPPQLVSLSLHGGYMHLASFHLLPASLISLKLHAGAMQVEFLWAQLPKTLRFLEVDWLYFHSGTLIVDEAEKIRNHLPLLERLLGYNSGDFFKFATNRIDTASDFTYFSSVWASQSQFIAEK